MSTYDEFSALYDMFTDDVDYKGNTEKLLSYFKKYDRPPTLLLDLACGTGGFSFEFAKNGIDVIGVDRSEGMLSSAIEKLSPGSNNPLFLNQSAEELELYGTVDGAVCLLDSINHIIDEDALQTAFNRVSLFLEPGRLFMFDVNTPYKHSQVLGNNTFVREKDNAFCVWQNQCEDDVTVDIFLDLFVEREDGNYNRLSEEFSERAYSDDEITQMAVASGLEVLDRIDWDSGEEPKEDSQRILYIVRKK